MNFLYTLQGRPPAGTADIAWMLRQSLGGGRYPNLNNSQSNL